MSVGYEKTVLIDMDGVMADFNGAIIQHLSKRDDAFIASASQTHFYIADEYPDYRQLIKDAYRSRGFFESLPILPGVIDGLQQIYDLGYTPEVCTSAIPSARYCIAEKQAWIKQNLVTHFGRSILKSAHITVNKHMINGLVLIDDMPEIADSDTASWQQLIFDQPYNQASPGTRLFGWCDPSLGEKLRLAEESLYQRQLGILATRTSTL